MPTFYNYSGETKNLMHMENICAVFAFNKKYDEFHYIVMYLSTGRVPRMHRLMYLTNLNKNW